MKAWRTWSIALLAALTLSGCATYHREKADMLRDGRSKRLVDAQDRLADAHAARQGLEEDRRSAQEELDYLRADLQEVNGNLDAQIARLAQARSSAKISAQQEKQVRRRLTELTQAFNDKALEVETARVGGSQAEVLRKSQELARLRQELAQLDREIEILSQ